MENKENKIAGTNCYNCKYIAGKNESIFIEEINKSGGIDPKNDFEMYRAEACDVITLPGGSKEEVLEKKHCHHPKVDMYVTSRMCCALWDNDAVSRPWKK